MSETVLDRFLRYVSYETTSYEEKKDTCSSDKMFLLAEQLLIELQKLHPDEISINRFGIIDAKFYGKDKKQMIAFLSHMDTSNQASGKDVKPRIVQYEGGDIQLNTDMVLSPKEFPALNHSLHHKLIVTDGTTLLGGDDKAGIAVIMTALNELAEKKEEHRPLEIIFTTDEEIGADADHVSMEVVKSKHGYTVDGGASEEINIETFTAYSMDVEVKGKSIHPGFAKNRMVNAQNVFIEFHDALPRYLRPEETDKKEPFYHLCTMNGNEDHCQGSYIIRSFDEEEVKQLVRLAELTARRINDSLGYEAISLNIKNQYHNMKIELDKHPEILEELEGAYREVRIPYQYIAVRGGTTGSQLAFKGLPCPNIGDGDYNCHGRYEYVDLNEMEDMVKVVKNLMKA